MIRKFISLATAIVILDVYLRSQLYSNDPLFLFASNKLAINIGMVLLAGAVVTVSFRNKFKNWLSFAAVAALAVILSVVGMVGIFLSNMVYSFSNILLPLDYMFMLESGIVLGICALSYEHAPSPYRFKLPEPAALLSKFAFPVPKFPQSPTPAGPRRPQTA